MPAADQIYIAFMYPIPTCLLFKRTKLKKTPVIFQICICHVKKTERRQITNNNQENEKAMIKR